MAENIPDNKPKTVRRPRLKLPFDNRKEDAGVWAYDHRIGLCVTIIAYLVLMIAFVSSKIVVGRRPHTQGMFIDLQTLAELEKERDRLEQQVRERQQQDPIDWKTVQNQVSNENALNEKLRDDRGTNAAALNDAAAEAERNKVHNVKESTAPQDALVIDDDISKIQYKLAKCCNPIKGDEVFGFVTINSGITIHRCDCPNAKRMRENYPYRVIDARWRSTAEGAFRVSLRIVAADTTGMANHITEVISRDLKLNIRSINFASLANGCIAGTVSVEVPGAGVVDTLIHSIMRIKGVQRAFRINN